MVFNMMKQHKKSRSELKRDAILCAAREAFHEFGVQNTSMDKLASLANVSKRTVYNHFSAKEALVMELLSELWRDSTPPESLKDMESQSLEVQLTTLLLQEIYVFAQPSYLDMAKVAFGHFLFKPEELQEQINQMSKEDTALYVWLKQQTESGALDIKDLLKALSQLHNLIKGAAFWPQLIGAKAPIEGEESRMLANDTARLFLSFYAK